MSTALNSLVNTYLGEAHPKVAKVFAKEAPLDDVQCRKVYGGQSIQALVLKHAARRLPAGDDSSDDEAPPRKAVKVSPRAAPRKAPIPDSSSDDDEPVKKPVAKKASPKTSPRLAARKAPIPDSSSDDDEPVKKPVAKKSSPKIVAKKAPVADSSDSDDGAPVVRKPTPAVKRPVAQDDSDSEDGPVAVKGSAPATNAARHEESNLKHKGPSNRNADGTYKRFQRIDPTKVAFTHDALRDNRPGQEHLVLRQNQEMMRVKGKDFNKLKQKNKGKFYGAGVDLSVRSFQFPDSDDD